MHNFVSLTAVAIGRLKWLVLSEKCKCKVRYTCSNAFYTSQTRDRKRFTISEVAADRHKLMI